MPIKPPAPPSLTTGTVRITHKAIGRATSSSASTAKSRAKRRAEDLVKFLKARYVQLKANKPPTKVGDMGPNVFENGKRRIRQTGLAIQVSIEHTIYVEAWWVRRP